MTSEDFISIVDLSRARDVAGRRAVAGSIDAALRTSGFFVVVGHGVAPEIVDGLAAQARQLFQQSVATKREVRFDLARAKLGWSALGTIAVAAPEDQAAQPDLCEIFSYTSPFPMRGSGRFENQWPDVPGLRGTLLEAYAAVEHLHREIRRLAARALGLDEDWFEPFHSGAGSSLATVNWYPPPPTALASGQLRKGAHTDAGSFTVLWQESEGLQVYRGGGRWAPVPVVPNSFVVNAGDLMTHWTNGQWLSSRHRVVNSTGPGSHDRLSVAFFANPSDDAVVAPINSRTGDRGAINAGQYIAEKLAGYSGGALPEVTS